MRFVSPILSILVLVCMNGFTPGQDPPRLEPFVHKKRKSGQALRQAKLGRGGDDVRSTIETFRWNPAGNQSRLGELGQHPEASLASWWGDPPGEA